MKKNFKPVLLFVVLILYIFIASCNSSQGQQGQTTGTTLTGGTTDSLPPSGQTEGSERSLSSGTESASAQTDTYASVTGSETSTESASGQTTEKDNTSAQASVTETATSAARKTTASAAKTSATEAAKPTVTKKQTQTTTEAAIASSSETSAASSETSASVSETTAAPTSPPAVDPSPKSYKLSYDSITDISKSSNVFVFIIDRFDRVFAESAFMHDPSVFSSLEGFTYFGDNISLYGH
ncbi:MAG: hypothetical protein IJS94_01220, partial [Clostridia bacterium]|nr:hypothetical protein [Clostridia bacterium]